VQYLYDYDLFPEEPEVKPRRLCRPVLAFAIALAAFTPSYAQTTLQYRWTQGDVLLYRTVLKTTTNVTGGPAGAVEQTLTQTQTVKLIVAAVGPDGSATLRQTIEAVAMEIGGPMGKMAYDSTKPPPANDEDPRSATLAKTFGAMVGEAISVTIAPNGAVRSILGTAKIVDKLMKGLPMDPLAAGLAQNIKAMLSDDALRTSLEQSFSRMPDQPVKPGDTWTAEQTLGVDVIGKITGTSTFTLKAIEGTGDNAVARIGVSLAIRQETTPGTGASMTVKLGASKGEGELLFHVGKGRVERNSMRTEMPSTITMRGREGGPATIQNNTTTSMTMERVEK
jgi:hypothetical protein